MYIVATFTARVLETIQGRLVYMNGKFMCQIDSKINVKNELQIYANMMISI